MFRKLSEEEEHKFRRSVYEDEKINDILVYLTLCHPVIRDEFMKRFELEVGKNE